MAWLQHLPKLPSRDALLASRWARPFARLLGAPGLWRWNRRSVARGAALGLFVGILIPLVQSPFAALLSTVVRANLAVAVVATFITNPLTTPLVYVAAYQIGIRLLAVDTANPLVDMSGTLAVFERAMEWLLTASLPTAVGLVAMAFSAAVLGYGAVQIGWRLRTVRRWRQRARLRAAVVA